MVLRRPLMLIASKITLKKIFLLCSGAILFVSCYSIKSKPEEQTNVNNGLHLCQFDNHGKSFEILIPTQLRSSSYYSYPYHFDGLELCNEYLFLSGKDTCRLELNYWTGNFSSMVYVFKLNCTYA